MVPKRKGSEMKKILPIIAAFLIGGLIGFLVGGEVGMYYTKWIQKEAALLAAGWMSQMATWACESGTASEASKALHNHLTVMERMLASKLEPDMPELIRADMTITLTRLSLIEEAMGHSEEAKQLQQRAADSARMTGYKSATPESIRSFVMRNTNFVSLLTKARQQR